MGSDCSSSLKLTKENALKAHNWRMTHTNSVRNAFVKRKLYDIRQDYHLNHDKVLGKGGYGVVYEGEKVHKNTDHKHSERHYAIKVCEKSACDVARLERELLLLRDVDHPNIVRIFEVYDITSHLYFVMELCQGGHLG